MTTVTPLLKRMLLALALAALFGLTGSARGETPGARAAGESALPHLQETQAVDYLAEHGLLEDLQAALDTSRADQPVPDEDTPPVYFVWAIGGSWAFVGAPGDDEGAGAAYAFRLTTGGTWLPGTKLVDEAGTASDAFGCALAEHGNELYVGVCNVDDGTGALHVFQRHGGDPTTWTATETFVPADAGPGSHFGSPLTAGGNTVLAGAFADVPEDTALYFLRRKQGSDITFAVTKKLDSTTEPDDDDFKDFGVGGFARFGERTVLVPLDDTGDSELFAHNETALGRGTLPRMNGRSLVADTDTLALVPDPTRVYVQSNTYGGTGCPQGSVGQSFANDRLSFTMIFDSFVASSGPGVPVTESRKNCQLNINLRIPNGFSYSVATFDYRGYMNLPAGVAAEQKVTYYFQGEVKQASAGLRFTGPVNRDYLSRDTLGLAAMLWMACGRNVPLNVNSQVRLTGLLSRQAQVTSDSFDGKVKHIMGLQFRRC
jgi:hypothetical protein